MYQNCTFITDCHKDELIHIIFTPCPNNNKVVAFMNGTEVIQYTNFINVHNKQDTEEYDHYIYEVNSKTLLRKEKHDLSLLPNDAVKSVYVLVEQNYNEDDDPYLISPNMVIGVGNQFFNKPIYWTRVEHEGKQKSKEDERKNPYKVRPSLDAILFDPYLQIYRPLTLNLQSIYWRFYFLPIYEKRYFIKRVPNAKVITFIRYRRIKVI